MVGTAQHAALRLTLLFGLIAAMPVAIGLLILLTLRLPWRKSRRRRSSSLTSEWRPKALRSYKRTGPLE